MQARKSSGDPAHVIAALNYFSELQAGDYVELWAAADSTSPYMEAYAAQVAPPFAMPSIPSVVATLTFVSAV